MSHQLDFLVVGAGLFGSVFARRAAESGKNVLVIDRRRHLAGNCFSERVEGIEVHRYGPHIFHTNDFRVWEFLNRFAEFNHYRHRGLVRRGKRLYSFPINLATLHDLWGVTTPAEAERRLQAERIPAERDDLESWIVSQVGRELYELFVRDYTAKQWGREPRDLPASIIKRIPIRLTWDDRYFEDRYQGIPVGGYTRLFENVLDHPRIRIETGVDYFAHRFDISKAARQLIYTGMIDEFFEYRYGALEYRSLRFDTASMAGDYQGAAIVNQGSADVPYTRSVEHKHFAFQQSERTVVTFEHPQPYVPGGEAYYPIRDVANTQRYQRYRMLAQSTGVVFGGRLGSYQYFDMHQVVAQALATADDLLGAGAAGIIRRAA